MEKLVSHFSLKKRQLGLEIGPLLSDVNIQQIGPYRLSRPCTMRRTTSVGSSSTAAAVPLMKIEVQNFKIEKVESQISKLRNF